MRRIRIYLARAMSGRTKAEVVTEAEKDASFFRQAGLDVLCPVEKERVKKESGAINASRKEMEGHWPEDKRMIRESDIIFDMTPHLNSEGCKHELGYARYALWKPVVRIFPASKLPSAASVAMFEDDYVCDSHIEAIEYVYRMFDSRYKRILWRLKMLNRCLLKWIWYQIQQFK